MDTNALITSLVKAIADQIAPAIEARIRENMGINPPVTVTSTKQVEEAVNRWFNTHPSTVTHDELEAKLNNLHIDAGNIENLDSQIKFLIERSDVVEGAIEGAILHASQIDDLDDAVAQQVCKTEISVEQIKDFDRIVRDYVRNTLSNSGVSIVNGTLELNLPA
jgi:hypothetical protein